MRIPYLLLLLSLPACTGTSSDKPADSDTDGDTDTDTDTTVDDTGGPDTDLHAPSTPEIAIEPAAPPAGVDFAVVVLTPSTDPDGDAVTYRYAWTADGAPQSGLTTEAVAGSSTVDGQVWAVTVTPTDGANDGTPATATVTIGNTAPSAPGVTFDPASPVDHDTITLVLDPAPVDPDGDALTTSVTWYKNGSLRTDFGDGLVVDGRNVRGGDVFRAVVAVTDGYHDPVGAEGTVAVENNPPTLTTPEVEPTSPLDSDDLTVSATGSDPDGNALTYTYRWFRNGVEAVDVGDSDTVAAAFTAVNDAWYAEVTVSDGTDTATDHSNTVTIIPWEGHVYTRTITTRIAPDGSTASGTWVDSILSHGSSYGENDCDLVWQIDGSDDPRACPGCDWAFDATFTLDSASVVTTAGAQCTGLDGDGTGTLTYDIGRATFDAELYVGSYYYGYRDAVSFTGDGTSSYGRYGSDYHTAAYTTDTAGYTTLTAYQYVVEYY